MSLVLVSVAFCIISAIIFRPSHSTLNRTYIFISAEKANINSLENDVRAVMSDMNRSYKNTVSKVYLVNSDDDMDVLKICMNLCKEFDRLRICSLSDVTDIIK